MKPEKSFPQAKLAEALILAGAVLIVTCLLHSVKKHQHQANLIAKA